MADLRLFAAFCKCPLMRVRNRLGFKCMEVREGLGFWAVIVGEKGEGSWLQSYKFYRSKGDGEFDTQVPRTAGTATQKCFSQDFFNSEEERDYLRLAHDAMGAYAVKFVF